MGPGAPDVERQSAPAGQHLELRRGDGRPGRPTFVGDILGDWREEAVYTNASHDELIIFSTNQPTTTRLYTLAHHPAYRNAMTFKGYMQSHHPDYFLGAGMAQPPRPNITYAGGGAATVGPSDRPARTRR